MFPSFPQVSALLWTLPDALLLSSRLSFSFYRSISFYFPLPSLAILLLSRSEYLPSFSANLPLLFLSVIPLSLSVNFPASLGFPEEDFPLHFLLFRSKGRFHPFSKQREQDFLPFPTLCRKPLSSLFLRDHRQSEADFRASSSLYDLPLYEFLCLPSSSIRPFSFLRHFPNDLVSLFPSPPLSSSYRLSP